MSMAAIKAIFSANRVTRPLRMGLFALVFLSTSVTSAVAQPLISKFVAGEHYAVLDNPLKLADEGVVEVMEVFWYGCSHCYSFEPYVKNWKKTMADDVVFMRTPAVWRKQMKSHAALYYMAEQLDLPGEIHSDLFVLLTKEQSLDDPQRFAQVFAKYDVAEEDFLKLYKSFAITAKVKQGENRVRKNYKVGGTPEMVVNGKYRVTMKMAGNPTELFEIIDFLIDLERS